MCMQAGFAFLPIFHSLAHCIPLEFTNIKRFMVSPIALIFFYGSDQLKVALIVQTELELWNMNVFLSFVLRLSFRETMWQHNNRTNTLKFSNT